MKPFAFATTSAAKALFRRDATPGVNQGGGTSPPSSLPSKKYMTSSPAIELREFYAQESERIRENFAAMVDGASAIVARSALVDALAKRLWTKHIAPESKDPPGFALVALGGYGRQWLFPFSDIDILFLYARSSEEEKYRIPVRQFSQEIWDLRLKQIGRAHV